MGCQVVTIAMSDGAFAEQTGRAVAEQLGFRYINSEIIDWAAGKGGVDPRDVESVEHSPPLVARVLEFLASAPMDPTVWTDGFEPVVNPSAGYRSLIQQVIRETAAAGSAVIVAHAAGILLAGLPDIPRVFVAASVETRIARLQAEQQIDQREAARRIARADRERAAYRERFYHVRQESPTHYDLVVNTDTLSAGVAARVIAAAAR